jgi:tetratricopeptide (TPR) repeat protein
VFWVHASNAARFEQSYRDIADRVKIAGRRDPQANIFKLVHDWLCDCRQRWLLVLDNVDDARYLFDVQASDQVQHCDDSRPASRPLYEYLPQCERGSILVTSRNKDAVLELVDEKSIVAVEPMDEAQALALFEKKLGVLEDNNDVAELAAELECMTLAIVQAAAYISQKASGCSVAEYLDKFKKSEHERTQLLSRDKSKHRQLRRDRDAKNTIFITWEISFKHIQQVRPSAADLLSLMSFFDRQGIPKNVLQRQAEQGGAQLNQQEHKRETVDRNKDDDRTQSSMSEDDFNEDMEALANFHLISVNTNNRVFEMHALVQLATRNWLSSNGKFEHWREHFISNLCAAFPAGEYENWEVCKALYAHAKSAAGHRPEKESSLAQWGALLYHASWYAWSMGNITDAESLALNSVEASRTVFGQGHENTLRSMGMLGLVYSRGGHWQEAAIIREQAMEASKKELGTDHPDTLTIMGHLAVTYGNQGRWDDAEKLEVQVMEMRKTKLGADHPNTLTSMNNLASTYSNQGRRDDAEKLQVQVMETLKTKLGADHPNTLTSMNNLASTYRSQGRWDAAEELEVQVMETSKEKLGADHPSTLTSMANLASTLWNQGRWDAAEELFVQVMETSKKKLGADHPSTLTSMANLASTYWNQGRWDAAEELFVQVMETFKKKLGADRPDTLTSIANLAFT